MINGDNENSAYLWIILTYFKSKTFKVFLKDCCFSPTQTATESTLHYSYYSLSLSGRSNANVCKCSVFHSAAICHWQTARGDVGLLLATRQWQINNVFISDCLLILKGKIMATDHLTGRISILAAPTVSGATAQVTLGSNVNSEALWRTFK